MRIEDGIVRMGSWLFIGLVAVNPGVFAQASEKTETDNSEHEHRQIAERNRELNKFLKTALRNSKQREENSDEEGAPLSLGLPATISPNLPEEDGFVLFKSTSLVGPAISNDGNITFSRTGLKWDDVFKEESWARLPRGKRILRDKSRGFEAWGYPTGTRVLHRISLKSSPPEIFEIRLSKKLHGGKWAFGLYKTQAGSPRLILHRRGAPKISFKVSLPAGPVRVEMERLHPQSCRLCHFNHGINTERYWEDVEHVGPCAFVPDNPSIIGEWAHTYEIKYGYSPFTP